MPTSIQARDLSGGMRVDIPASVAEGTDNETIAEYEYAEVESVNGGWADSLASPGQVVIYAPNFVSPIIVAGNLPLDVQD